MKRKQALVNKDYLLQKFECKGGWTYVEIPEIPMPKTPFGMLKVKGKIDDYEFSNVNLMPLGNGHLFLAVRSELRKKLKKEAPESVRLILYEDKTALVIPKELLLCMELEEGVVEKFMHYSNGQKKAFIDWINSAKTEETKVDRIAKAIGMVQKGEKFY